MVGGQDARFKQRTRQRSDPGIPKNTLAWRGTILACLLLGCGPVTATSVIDDAELALVRARAADADRFAPYEATLAELYLTKAREEQGHARYADARALANEALRYAGAAARKASDNRAAPAAGSAAVPKR